MFSKRTAPAAPTAEDFSCQDVPRADRKISIAEHFALLRPRYVLNQQRGAPRMAAPVLIKKQLSVVARQPSGTSGWIHSLGYLCSALRRDGLTADELILQLSTFLRSGELFLKLRTRTLRRMRSRLAADQPRRGGE